MRPFPVALVLSAVLALAARAGDLRPFEDAALHAVQFLNRSEGWAVGEEGVVWRTIDGGQNWERLPTGVRAALRSVYFLNPYTGWVAGREELPHGGSAGVLLFTRDGGLRWQRIGANALPGLNRVRFLDIHTGFVAGDGSDQYPSGVFTTSDSGRTWLPVPGPRCPAWLAADFQDAQTAALAGAWGRLAILRNGRLGTADVDTLGGRSVRGLQVVGSRAVAVGQGGLVLDSKDSAGARWGYNPIFAAGGRKPLLSREVLAGWDFHAVHCVGDHVWVVGRPGAVVLHSADRGQTWEVQVTGQPLPLHGVFFVDDRRGWAVGELGSVLATTDGGQTWRVQRRGGLRAAVLFIHARATGLPVDTVAVLGGEEGYLTAALRVTASDPGSAALGRASEAQRFALAVRRSGGAAGETLWQFPLPQHLSRADKGDLLKAWNQLHTGGAPEELLRQLVLALRIWRPEVVVTDHPDAHVSGSPTEALVAEAVHEAFTRAADPKAFPEQIERLGLEPWRAAKLYGVWEGRREAQVVLDLNEARRRLEATARDFAAPAAALLADAPLALPAQRYYRLLDSRVAGAAGHHDLMQGLALPPGGVARRALEPAAELDAAVLKTIQARRNLQLLAETPAEGLTDPAKLLARIGPTLEHLPEDQGAQAALAVANQYARLGQWALAREAFLLLVDRYPAHPQAVDAYRWLIRHNSSSEARRRHELGQFLVTAQAELRPTPVQPLKLASLPIPGAKQQTATIQRGDVTAVQTRQLTLLSDTAEARQWYQGSLEVGHRLAAFGPLFASDPSLQFSLQAARRHLGDFETAREWYVRFRNQQTDGPWRAAAGAELWLAHRSGPPPKPAAACRQAPTRPFLDGNFDDACWQGLPPLVLKNAVGDTVKEYGTEAWLAYDQDFLYLALRCRHPADRQVPPVKVRPRDADVRPYDRVSLLLDLDRDYATYFHLQIDQRGCVCEDCWGDRSWNPRWFVACRSDAESWQIEAAVPLIELTGEAVTVGRAWACNVVRVLPGRGVQAWSVPAEVQPRPEGMGLLVFTPNPEAAEPLPEVPGQKPGR